MKTEIDSIEIPEEYVDLCGEWAWGVECMLRAVDSTGGLTLGTRRPWNNDVGRSLTDHEWYVSLWNGLSCDVAYCARMAEKTGHEDGPALRRFEAFCDKTAARLRAEYGLQDSDAV